MAVEDRDAERTAVSGRRTPAATALEIGGREEWANEEGVKVSSSDRSVIFIFSFLFFFLHVCVRERDLSSNPKCFNCLLVDASILDMGFSS